MTDTRDELARVLHDHDSLHSPENAGRICGSHCMGVFGKRADAILASGVLANLRADAWDEGYLDGGAEPGMRDNPYRAEATS